MEAPGDLEQVQLTRSLVLWQRRRGHRSATDDVLCAWAGLEAAPGAREILDLGAGQGSVTLMMAGARPAARFVAVEAQPLSHALLERNLSANGLERRISAICADLRAVDLGTRRFDLITGSPPFMPPGSGTLPRDPQRAAARFELRGGIEAYLDAAARWLAPTGVASFLMDGAQDERCLAAVTSAGLHLVHRTVVYPRVDAAPRYIIYVAARTGPDAAGESALRVRDARGAWTADFRAIRATLDLPGA